jgi:luciferase family oxidoreductase group 1
MALTLSVLDLSPVSSGSTPSDAIANSIDLARRVEALGYNRYWLAEHHNMAGIASSSPEILIGQVAAQTRRMRIGSGGIMLPNHAPLKVAESFQTLEALFPGRIDLGIGRAPGSDPKTAQALRRSPAALGGDDLPQQLSELFAFSTGGFPSGHPFQAVRAVPIGVALPPVWLLGSSDYSARLAGQLGLGFAFARHINPHGAEEAMEIYRDHFSPSESNASPKSILTISVISAETEDEAETLAQSLDLAWLRLSRGRPEAFPSPDEARVYPYTDMERYQVQATRERLILGNVANVRAQLCRLASQTGVDEIMVTTIVHDHAARVRSYELLAKAFELSGE